MFEKNVYMSENSGGEGDKGQGSGGVDVQAQIKEAVRKATEGLNTKNQQLLDELKNTKEKAKQFDGLDLEKLKNLQKHMDESEEAKLIADGKLDEVFNRRFARVNEDNQTRLNALAQSKEESDKKATKYEELYSKERIRNQAIRAAEKSGVNPDAIDDVVDKVLARFSLGEDGSLEARDEKGGLIMSKDGKTVLQPEEYINETLKSKFSYYWPSSQGAGFGGGGRDSGGSMDVNDEKVLVAAKSKNLSEFRRLRKKQSSN